jgi:hypothetical protein
MPASCRRYPSHARTRLYSVRLRYESCHGKSLAGLQAREKYFRIKRIECRSVAQPGSVPALGRVKLLSNQSIAFRVFLVFPNNPGNLLFARRTTLMPVSDRVLIQRKTRRSPPKGRICFGFQLRTKDRAGRLHPLDWHTVLPIRVRADSATHSRSVSGAPMIRSRSGSMANGSLWPTRGIDNGNPSKTFGCEIHSSGTYRIPAKRADTGDITNAVSKIRQRPRREKCPARPLLPAND